MTHRIEILAHADDGRAKTLEHQLKASHPDSAVRVVDVFTSENPAAASPAFIASLTNPVTQAANAPLPAFDYALEIGFLPGVTDNIGHTASELLGLLNAEGDKTVYSSRLYLLTSKTLKESGVKALAKTLSNSLIQRATIKSAAQFAQDGGMGITLPKVSLHNTGQATDSVNLDVPDTELENIGKNGIANPDGSRRGPLGLSLLYMKAIQAHFKSLNRAPTDIELETLAQTWSEHCKHTIFASPIDDIKDGLYRHYIKRATQDIRAQKGENDICVSVFSDNAGGIIFDENYLITDKVETHNSPSALDPFGGAITGIVGVNRDCIGFGMGAKPVINRYGFCLAPVKACHPEQSEGSMISGDSSAWPQNDKNQYFRDSALTNPILSPETIMKGVVAGVEAGGNCSGIPTPQGFVVFDDRFVGKPLVFVGTIGLIPRTINGKDGHVKKAQAGDAIVMVGGRVGRDGIHGATFSSVALDEGSPATAVQIGDPITQKKMSDAIIKELRPLGWYNAITDNGAGGLSSSVGEMGEQSGGFHVKLDKVPLKYPGMSPWEIWISESQERMTLAVPPENVKKLIDFFDKRGVEATAIGTYTDTGRAHITWYGDTIMDMSMDFLHDGVPETPLTSTFTRGGEAEPVFPLPMPCHPEQSEGSVRSRDSSASPQNDILNHNTLLLRMLSRPNICSKEFIATQYDHNVQGTAVMGPLQGPGRVYAETSITRPVLTSPKGIVLSQGLFPRYSDIDTGAMAAAALDMAVRNAVAAGVDLNQLALLDNFCWCSSDEPERLGQLKRAAEIIYDMAVKYETPFISGKDSMFNDFKGFDTNGNAVKISAPPTLLISSIGVIPHIDMAIDLAPKAVGDLVYVLGETKDECGASEYYAERGVLGSNVPAVNAHENLRLYKLYGRAVRAHLISSALAVGMGGLGVALAKKAIAGQMGMDIDLSALCHPETPQGLKDLDSSASVTLQNDKVLYSESAGRILVTVSPQNKEKFEKTFKDLSCVFHAGHVAYSTKLNIKNILSVEIDKLHEAYKTPLRGY